MTRLTTDPNDKELGYGYDLSPSPQQKVYLILSEEERRKGFVRPYKTSYRHVGVRPKYPLRELTEDEKERYNDESYVMFEIYPSEMLPKTGKFWTQKQLESGCGTVTNMGKELSETYARNPKFYGATYCVYCQMHRPVGEFVWTSDGEIVGS